jgi:anti-anti-sigma factor
LAVENLNTGAHRHMESIEKRIENYAVVFNVNLIRATLNEAAEFKDYLEEAIVESDKDIIVNLSECEHLDSTFLGVLVSGFKRLKKQNRSLVIIEPIEQSSIFLTLNSIGKIFPLYNNVKIALEDIENKRLLENEISDLGSERDEASQKFPQNISAGAKIKIPKDESYDKKKQKEKVKAELPKEILKTSTPLENKFSSDEELILIEDTTDGEALEELISDSKKSTAVENVPAFSKEENKAPRVTRSEPVTAIKEMEFMKGTVEWNFGFS